MSFQPLLASWFSWARIHSLEERAFASFFNGKSEDQTPNVYMEIRNAIMKKFHMDPQSWVEPNDLVGLSIGNSEARRQVMEFLDHWGLINFQPFPLLDSTMSAANVDEVAKTASLIEKLYHFQEVQLCPRAGSETNISELTLPSQLLPESPISENLLSPDGLAVEYHCNACSTDCSKKRYHCQTKADFDLCSECYNDGKFGFGMVPADFILMENAEVPGSSGGNWTDQETLLLLEALELYGEDWNEIADHVATKTKEQCILYFVQMPIEDSFLDGEDSNNAGSSHQIVDPVLSIENLSALDAVETSKEKNEANGEQPVLLPSGTSERKDAVSTNVAQVTSDDFAISALVAAFRAVGYRPSKGEPFSFSEAGTVLIRFGGT